MRSRRINSNQERGAVAIMIAVLFSSMVLLGCAALSIDIGRIGAERRVLQNGADAVALSVAKDCAKAASCLPGGTLNQTLANDNAGADNFTKIGRFDGDDTKAICGTGPGLPACPPLEGHLRDCVEPAGGMPATWVRAYTTTQNSADATDTILPYIFAQTLTQTPGDGHQVQACAQAGMLPGFPGKVAPIVQAQCAWDYATDDGTSFPPKPPYSPPTLPASVDQITMIRLQTGGSSSDGTKCSAAGPGHYAPGSFGWLDSEDCEAVLVSDTGTVSGKPGSAKPTGCDWKDDVEKWAGQILYIPIFYKAEGNGTKTDYYLNGVSAFYVAGVSINSAEDWVFDPTDSALTGGDELHACYTGLKWPVDDPSTPTVDETKKHVGDCMWGWFLDPIIPAGSVGGGTPRGISTISLLG